MESKKGFDEFTTAIATGDINLVKKIIKEKNIDSIINDSYFIYGKDYTPLTLAIIYKQIDIAKELLKIENLQINNYNPLDLAITNNDIQIIEELIKRNDLDIAKLNENNIVQLLNIINNSENSNTKKVFVNYLKLHKEKSIELLNQVIENNNSEIMQFLIENLNIEYLEQVKKENIEELLKNCLSLGNSLILVKLINSSNPNFKEYISNNPQIYNDLIDLFYDSKNYELIKELEKGIENKIDKLNNEQLIKIVENIRNRENPNIKLFNLLIVKINEPERKKYLKPIKNINQNKQGKDQVTINREFIINGETNFIEIKDIAYAKIKDKNNNSKIIISNNKMYKTTYNEDGSKIVIHYKANKEEILFTEIIKEDKIIKIEFNENDFEKIKKESKNESERKNRIINYFRDETIKIHNIDYKSVDAFDDILSHTICAQTYLGEYLENKEQNISFDLNLSEINNINMQAENISEEFIKFNNNKIEYISDKIIKSLNLENEDKTFIFDLGYILNPDKISVENISNHGSHTTQIVISNGKAIMINTGGDKKFDKEFIKQINKKVKEKSNITQNSIENINNMFQLKEFGVCNVASKIYLNILFTEYKKHFGSLSKITERMYNFQKALKNINKKSEEEIKECFEEKGQKKFNEIKELGDIVKKTNDIVKRDYKNYFSEENKEFTKFSNTLNIFIKEFDKEIPKQNTSTLTLD